MKFNTSYEFKSGEPCPSGSRFRKTYMRSAGEDRALIEKGTENVYDSIQKAADGHTIADLLARARNGDPLAIPEPTGLGDFDVSRVPTDLLDAHHMIVDAKNQFAAMPAEARAQFGNSFDAFLASVTDGSAIKKLTSTQAQSSDKTVPANNEQLLEQIRNIVGGSNG